MSDELRNKLIRLAYNKPELRGDLLPLITKESGMWQKIKRSLIRIFSKDVEEYTKDFKRMGFNIHNQDERHQNWRDEYTGMGSVIIHTWETTTPSGLEVVIKWTDIIGEKMYNEGKVVMVDRYRSKAQGWSKEDKERYKKNKGFIVWDIYFKDPKGKKQFIELSKEKDAYRLLQKVVRL